MKLPRRRFLRLAAGAAALPAVSRIAWAQSYPGWLLNGPSRLIQDEEGLLVQSRIGSSAPVI